VSKAISIRECHIKGLELLGYDSAQFRDAADPWTDDELYNALVQGMDERIDEENEKVKADPNYEVTIVTCDCNQEFPDGLFTNEPCPFCGDAPPIEDMGTEIVDSEFEEEELGGEFDEEELAGDVEEFVAKVPGGECFGNSFNIEDKTCSVCGERQECSDILARPKCFKSWDEVCATDFTGCYYFQICMDVTSENTIPEKVVEEASVSVVEKTKMASEVPISDRPECFGIKEVYDAYSGNSADSESCQQSCIMEPDCKAEIGYEEEVLKDVLDTSDEQKPECFGVEYNADDLDSCGQCDYAIDCSRKFAAKNSSELDLESKKVAPKRTIKKTGDKPKTTAKKTASKKSTTKKTTQKKTPMKKAALKNPVVPKPDTQAGKIYALLDESKEPLTAKEIATKTGVPRNTVGAYLGQYTKSKVFKNCGGRPAIYTIAD